MPDGVVFPDWPAPACIGAAVSTSQSPGASSGSYAGCNLGLGTDEDKAVVAANRRQLQKVFDLAQPPLWLSQVHGKKVVDAASWQSTQGAPQADAAVAHEAPATLAILTADCLPVLLCSKDGRTIGAAHAGWRGLAQGVLEACVAAMDVSPRSIMAWLGPCIAQPSYEIDAPVHNAFPDQKQAFVPTRAGHWCVDLTQIARQRLAAVGVRDVYGGEFDTFIDGRFYSYRRQGKGSGRFASLVWFKS